jgi:hypothetical protein
MDVNESAGHAITCIIDNGPAMVITPGELAEAFAEWDRRFRADPEAFQAEAVRLLQGKPSSYGCDCALFLMALIAERRAQGKVTSDEFLSGRSDTPMHLQSFGDLLQTPPQPYPVFSRQIAAGSANENAGNVTLRCSAGSVTLPAYAVYDIAKLKQQMILLYPGVFGSASPDEIICRRDDDPRLHALPDAEDVRLGAAYYFELDTNYKGRNDDVRV